MASTTTTTCDRCGSVIASSSELDPTPATRGFIQAARAVNWEDQHRAQWDLCGACYDTALERLRDVLGQPHHEYLRPEELMPDMTAVAKANA